MLRAGLAYPFLVTLYTDMGISRSPAVLDLWEEFRVAAQFAKLWERAEEAVALIRRRELNGSLPTQDDVTSLPRFSSQGGSPAHWMQSCGLKSESVPQWFIRDELGIGSAVNVFDTARTLKQTNARRRRRYEETLARLEKARKVLARKVAA